MTTDDQLLAALRAAVPPVAAQVPTLDLWPAVVERTRKRQTWSWLDFGLASAALLGLIVRPDLIVLLAYYL